MKPIEHYLSYVESVRRYSPRTVELYREGLEEFSSWLGAQSEQEFLKLLTPQTIRNYEVHLLDFKGLKPRSVNLQLSLLSGFCRYLVSVDLLSSNPVKQIKRPQESKRLPVFLKKDAMLRYLRATQMYADGTILELYQGCESLAQKSDKHLKEVYDRILGRMTVSLLYSSGIRRAELISLNISSLDPSRATLRVLGKGDKMREIPLPDTVLKEISLYLKSVETMVGVQRRLDSPLLVTASGRRLYPEAVERLVKSELSEVEGIGGRKSPHVLRHTLATELLEDGSDLNSIKQLLGHSSLAATQVYTHNSIAQLKKVYQSAHPRAKNGGNDGD